MRLALGQLNATTGGFAGNGAGIARQVDRAGYERPQAAPGTRVPARAFGSGRRIPIAQVPRA